MGVQLLLPDELLRLRDQVVLRDLAVAIVVEENLGEVLGLVRNLGDQQEEGDLRVPGAVRRVQLRGDEVADVGRADLLRVDGELVEQDAEALGRAVAPSDQRERLADESAVLALPVRGERHEVSDCPEGDEVEKLRRGRPPEVLAEPADQLVRDPDTGELPVRVGLPSAMCVDDRQRGGERLRREVMVGDDRVDPRLQEGVDLGVVGDAAVGGDYQAESLLDGAEDERARDAVTVRPVPDVHLQRVLREERAKTAIEDGRPGQPIDVEVAVDEDPLPGLDRLHDAADGALHVGEQKRGMEASDVGIDQGLPRGAAALGEENGEWTGTAERRTDRINEGFVGIGSEFPLPPVPKGGPHLPFFALSAFRLQP